MVPFTCPQHSLLLCTPNLRLLLAVGHHSTHAQDRWKYCGVNTPWEHCSTSKWWDLVYKYPRSLAPLSPCTWSLWSVYSTLPARGSQKNWTPVAHSGNLFDNIIPFFLSHPCLISPLTFQCLLGPPPKKALVLESLSQCLLLREPNQSQWSKEITKPTITLSDCLWKPGQTLVERVYIAPGTYKMLNKCLSNEWPNFSLVFKILMSANHLLAYIVDQMLNVRMLKEVSTVTVILDINSSLGMHNSRIPMRTIVRVRKVLSSFLPSSFSIESNIREDFSFSGEDSTCF